VLIDVTQGDNLEGWMGDEFTRFLLTTSDRANRRMPQFLALSGAGRRTENERRHGTDFCHIIEEVSSHCLEHVTSFDCVIKYHLATEQFIAYCEFRKLKSSKLIPAVQFTNTQLLLVSSICRTFGAISWEK
jgi:hypothetical protein